MRFVCLGYIDEARWAEMSDVERSSFLDECFAYDDELRRGGHFLGGEALQGIDKAATLRIKDGKISVTGGSRTLAREQLGGILVLDATDLGHAIQLMSRHPGVRAGAFEIRPAIEAFNALIAERKL